MKRLALFAFVALLATSCNDITGNNDGQFTFDFLPLTWEPTLRDSAIAVAGAGTIQVSGVILLPTVCHSLQGRHNISGSTITMTVRATRMNATCAEDPDAASYRFESYGLRRGTHHVRVVHVIDNGSPSVVLEEDLVMP